MFGIGSICGAGNIDKKNAAEEDRTGGVVKMEDCLEEATIVRGCEADFGPRDLLCA